MRLKVKLSLLRSVLFSVEEGGPLKYLFVPVKRQHLYAVLATRIGAGYVFPVERHDGFGRAVCELGFINKDPLSRRPLRGRVDFLKSNTLRGNP